jgi:NAD(P)-dependent dehydrogenase (short-subunit alcohol dehydrogenase family)
MRDMMGKVAFITGGASGIGLSIAGSLARAGVRIVVADIDGAALETARSALADAGAEVLTARLDVADPASWREATDVAVARFGRIDVLCNNAGVGQGRLPNGDAIGLADMSESLWRLILDINVTGVFLGVRTVAPLMIRGGTGGHIVNTASMAGLFAPPGMVAYSASKFAVMGLTEGLRAELAPHAIGVSVLCPGAVESNLSATSAARRSSIPMTGQEPEAKLSPVRTLTGKMMKAASVGDRVLEGIRNDELYILTHPEYEPLIEDRFAAIRAAIGESAEPGHLDPESLLTRSRNPVYAGAAARTWPPI